MLSILRVSNGDTKMKYSTPSRWWRDKEDILKHDDQSRLVYMSFSAIALEIDSSF